MHEVSIISSAMDEIIIQCEANNIARVTEVTLAIGQFVAVDKFALEFAFNCVSKGTICENAILIVKEIYPKAYCENCNEEFEVTFINKNCPLCGETSQKITQGYEILLYRIEGE